MSKETLKSILDNFSSKDGEYVHFNWSGGEPLLQGDLFFEEVNRLVTEKGANVDYSIQTNGVLLTDEKLEKLRKLNFNVGVSFDGTVGLHVKQRRVPEKVAKRIYETLKQRGRDMNNIISVLTRHGLGMEKEIYDNLKGLAKNASVNVYIPTGNGRKNSSELLASPKEMGNMLIKFYDLWSQDESNFMLSPFTRILQSLVNPKGNHICEYSAEACNQVVGLDPEGNVYFCARATSDPNFYMGSLKTQSLDEILSNPIREKVYERREELRKECNCEYFDICNGGCPQEAAVNGDFFSKTYYCESRKMLFDYMVGSLKNE